MAHTFAHNGEKDFLFSPGYTVLKVMGVIFHAIKGQFNQK